MPNAHVLANVAGPAFPEADATPYVRQMTDEDPQAVIDELVSAGFLKREDGNISITHAGRIELRKPRGRPPRIAPKLDEPPPPAEAAVSFSDLAAANARAEAAERERDALVRHMEELKERIDNGKPPDPGVSSVEGEGHPEPSIITREEVDDLLAKSEEDASDAIHDMSSNTRRRFTELLHAELSDLVNQRGLAGENLKREADIEGLLGLFARLGEL